MNHARMLGGAALALLVIAGACQRRSEGPINTRTGAVRSDTALRDSGLGAGGADSNTRLAVPPGGPPDTVRRDSLMNSGRDTGTVTPGATPRAAKPTASRSTRSKVAADRSAPRASAPDSAATPSETTTASADQPLRDPYHTAPLDTVDAKTYQGWKYFNLNCARCHGEDVQGTTIAPHLILSLKPDGTIPNEQAFQTTVCGGRVAKGMPAWCSLGLTPAQIDPIYTYVKGRSDAKLHPGRPARRE